MLKDDLKRKAVSRLNRVNGQINGLKKMIESERDCVEVIIQIAAIRAAIGQLGSMLVQDHMEECVQAAIKKGNSKELVASLNKVMKQML
jgi:DNA-binding FrmR family transcriptional regulator